MIESGQIQVVVVSHDRPPNTLLSLWLCARGLVDWRPSSYDYDVGEVRNQAVRRFLHEDIPAGKRHLLLIDDDIVPLPESEAILSAEGELVYCGSVGPFGTRGHYGDGDFGENCCRMSHRLLQRMAYPYFKTEYREGVRVACDGRRFRDQAAANGIPSQMVGIVGHQQTCILVPINEPPGYRVAWPHELRD